MVCDKRDNQICDEERDGQLNTERERWREREIEARERERERER